MAMHFKKQEKTEAERKKSTERRGFYLALAVCLTAIGIACRRAPQAQKRSRRK